MSDALPNELVKAALEYASVGWPVFPCKPADKSPFTHHGVKDATTDPKQIKAWWTLHPDAMIGLATGSASDLLVLDVDVDTSKGLDGEVSLKALSNGASLPADQMAVRTPRGGRHLYFTMPRDMKIGNSAGKLGPGLDIRAGGGYVICAPSTNSDGIAYEWAPWGALYSPPDWLLEPLRPKESSHDPYRPPPSNGGNREQAYGDAALAAECNLVATAPEGSRNDQLFRSGCKLFELVAGGILSERQVRDALMDAAIAAGLTAVGSGKTIDSAAAHGLQNPRGPQERERTRPYTDYGADEIPPPEGRPSRPDRRW